MSLVPGTEAPAWAQWNPKVSGRPWTLGVEEEVMLLDPATWALAYAAEDVLPALPEDLAGQVEGETHGAAVELVTGVHDTVSGALGELRSLRRRLAVTLAEQDLCGGAAGTHPTAVWGDTVINSGARYEQIYGSMRELARREPTYALHVHVAVPDPDSAVRALDRMRGHVPLLLALSANSPFWQGRDTGLASARTPLFGAFPRTGIPRWFRSYEDYVSRVDLLLRVEAFPEPTFLWWDVRLQPSFGTLEVRVMDAQTRVEDSAALVAFVQCLVRLEATERGWLVDEHLGAQEVIDENRFLAARDGAAARLIDPVHQRRVPVAELVETLIDACAGHAQDLGCQAELEHVRVLAAEPPAGRQLAFARGPDRLPGLVRELAASFAPD